MNGIPLDLGPESKGVGSARGPAIELNNILAPIDFSSASRHGVAFAGAIAERFRSRLHLLYVVEPPSLPEWGYAHLPLREARLQHAAEEKLPQFPLQCGIDPRLVYSSKVRSGDADLEICKTAAEENIDLIVITSHGLGGFQHPFIFIGSTAERVVRDAPCPVLTVRDRALQMHPEKPAFAPKRILVTTDFSDASKKAFQYAVALARRFEASVTLLYVVPSQLRSELSHSGIVLEEKRLVEEARARLPRFREAELDPHLHVEALVLNGRPAHEICHTAETRQTDLIVMSTHGHTGLKRSVVGSVTENVVRHAPCPVLVVRERIHQFLKD